MFFFFGHLTFAYTHLSDALPIHTPCEMFDLSDPMLDPMLGTRCCDQLGASGQGWVTARFSFVAATGSPNATLRIVSDGKAAWWLGSVLSAWA